MVNPLTNLGPATLAHYRLYLGIAVAANLSNPMGRALYCTSRAINCGANFASPLSYNTATGFTYNNASRIMQNCKSATAQRWLAHFLQGGSLRALRYKNHAICLQAMYARNARAINL